MKIAFRVDSSNTIGMGHVTRCLTLAHALKQKGARCLFVIQDHEGHPQQSIRQQGFQVITTPVSDETRDAEHSMNAVQGVYPDWLIVDHYRLGAAWETALRPYCQKIMVIDDLANRNHDCDLLLDQNLVADMAHRYDRHVPPACTRLLGPEYALLQAEYRTLHSTILPRHNPITRIFAYFGGADNQDLTGRTIAAFAALKRADITLDVVINPTSRHAAKVHRLARGQSNISLHEALPSLAHVMQKADLAIGAGGATSWERCCLGLPSVVITLADNQKPIAQELHRQGYILWLGDQDTVDTTAIQAGLLDCLDNDRIQQWSQHCSALIDGKGIERLMAFLWR